MAVSLLRMPRRSRRIEETQPVAGDGRSGLQTETTAYKPGTIVRTARSAAGSGRREDAGIGVRKNDCGNPVAGPAAAPLRARIPQFGCPDRLPGPARAKGSPSTAWPGKTRCSGTIARRRHRPRDPTKAFCGMTRAPPPPPETKVMPTWPTGSTKVHRSPSSAEKAPMRQHAN